MRKAQTLHWPLDNKFGAFQSGGHLYINVPLHFFGYLSLVVLWIASARFWRYTSTHGIFPRKYSSPKCKNSSNLKNSRNFLFTLRCLFTLYVFSLFTLCFFFSNFMLFRKEKSSNSRFPCQERSLETINESLLCFDETFLFATFCLQLRNSTSYSRSIRLGRIAL